MTPEQVAMVLAKAAVFDQRNVGESDILAWLEVLEDTNPADAIAAVTRHYRETRERIMPSDVIRLAAQIADERRREALRARTNAVLSISAPAAAPEDRSAEVKQLLADLRDALPPVDETKYRRAEVLAWEKSRDREARAEPNPHYDPNAAA